MRKIEVSSGVFDKGASGTRVDMVTVMLALDVDTVAVAAAKARASDLICCAVCVS